MNNDLKKLLKHTNRKKKRNSVNDRKIYNKELYYYVSDLPSPDRLSGF